jgi:hypothetical protein
MMKNLGQWAGFHQSEEEWIDVVSNKININ